MNKDEFRKLIKDDIITACMIASTVIWKEKMREVSRKRRTFQWCRHTIINSKKRRWYNER